MFGRVCFFFFFLLLTPELLAQEEVIPVEVDSLYREDQFYVGFTYDLIAGNPADITSSQFSGGFHLGFIRDFPLNARRNIAIGVGLGWSIDTYGQNIFIGEDPSTGETAFSILDRDIIDFDTNRFSTQSLDVPLQLRWRTSSPGSYKFWRIYAGLRPSYIYYFKSRFIQQDNTVLQSDIPELERLNLGATFTFGYNTFNFHVFYSLNSLFDNARIEGQDLEVRSLQVGLVFFLL